MNIIIILVPLALAIGILFLLAFIWAAKKGQFDDLVTPAYRILIEDNITFEKKNNNNLTKEGKNS